MKTSFIKIGSDYLDAHAITRIVPESDPRLGQWKLYVFTDGISHGIAVVGAGTPENSDMMKKRLEWEEKHKDVLDEAVKGLIARIERARAEIDLTNRIENARSRCP